MALNTVLSPPIPLYQNVPIEPQFFKPSQFPITAITLGATTIVTMGTSTNGVTNNYVVGQNVRFIIPIANGTRELSGQSGVVISIPNPNQVEVNINSLGMNAFVAPSSFTPAQKGTIPQILAIGDFNSGAINSHGNMHTKTGIKGSFKNISPHED